MRIVFKEAYHDKLAKNSDDGSQEVFSPGREYKVKESFGKDMVKAGKADSVRKTFKNKED